MKLRDKIRDDGIFYDCCLDTFIEGYFLDEVDEDGIIRTFTFLG